jgi:hypothetical protein
MTDKSKDLETPQVELNETDLDNVAGGGVGANLSVEGSDGSYSKGRVH